MMFYVDEQIAIRNYKWKKAKEIAFVYWESKMTVGYKCVFRNNWRGFYMLPVGGENIIHDRYLLDRLFERAVRRISHQKCLYKCAHVFDYLFDAILSAVDETYVNECLELMELNDYDGHKPQTE